MLILEKRVLPMPSGNQGVDSQVVGSTWHSVKIEANIGASCLLDGLALHLFEALVEVRAHW